MSLDPSALPAWPALLTTDLACAYTSLSEVSLRWVAKSAGVRPVDVGGLAVTRWRRADLDSMIDSLPARGAPKAPQQPGQPTANDPGKAALERVQRRLKG